MAAAAQAWADGCAFDHDPNTGYGENLYASAGGSASDMCTAAVNKWCVPRRARPRGQTDLGGAGRRRAAGLPPQAGTPAGRTRAPPCAPAPQVRRGPGLELLVQLGQRDRPLHAAGVEVQHVGAPTAALGPGRGALARQQAARPRCCPLPDRAPACPCCRWAAAQRPAAPTAPLARPSPRGPSSSGAPAPAPAPALTAGPGPACGPRPRASDAAWPAVLPPLQPLRPARQLPGPVRGQRDAAGPARLCQPTAHTAPPAHTAAASRAAVAASQPTALPATQPAS